MIDYLLKVILIVCATTNGYYDPAIYGQSPTKWSMPYNPGCFDSGYGAVKPYIPVYYAPQTPPTLYGEPELPSSYGPPTKPTENKTMVNDGLTPPQLPAVPFLRQVDAVARPTRNYNYPKPSFTPMPQSYGSPYGSYGSYGLKMPETNNQQFVVIQQPHVLLPFPPMSPEFTSLGPMKQILTGNRPIKIEHRIDLVSSATTQSTEVVEEKTTTDSSTEGSRTNETLDLEDSTGPEEQN